jgi:hypothetical protein
MGAIDALGGQTLKPHVASSAKQVGADLALLEWRDENAVGPSRKQPRQIGLAQARGEGAQILAIERKEVEGIESRRSREWTQVCSN